MENKPWIITKSMWEEHARWYDKLTFVANIEFKDCPEEFLDFYSSIILDEDMESGFLSCEYLLNEDGSESEVFMYQLFFEDDFISVNDYFRDSPFDSDAIIKEIAMEMLNKNGKRMQK